MSMIGWVLGVTPSQIEAMRKSPEMAEELAHSGEGGGVGDSAELFKRLPPELLKRAASSEILQRMPPAIREAVQARIDQKREAPAAPQASMPKKDPGEQALCLEKSWHVLHFLFTGDVGPADGPGGALMGGEDIGEDMGYGPPRLLDPAGTKAFAAFLTTQDVEGLVARADPAAMIGDGVYGVGMRPGGEAQFVEQIRAETAAYFPVLRDYVAAAAAKGDGVLLWIS